MTQDELKMVLEALKNYAWHGEACPQHPTYSEPENYPKCTCGFDKAITAIEEALAQTQEPVAVVDVHEFYDNCANFSLLQKLPKGKHTLYTSPPQAQEPVIDKSAAIRIATVLGWTPPRTWVGLTDEEISEVLGSDIHDEPSGELRFIRAIEAKLKANNFA